VVIVLTLRRNYWSLWEIRRKRERK